MDDIQTNSRLSLLKGGGEMGERIRAYNWDDNAIGTPDNWCSGLYTTLGIIINSKFPMFLWWGKDLIQFYNDAYRPRFGDNGKHPLALGQMGGDCWQETWPVIKPSIDQVLAGGDGIWMEDQLLPICRNGEMEDAYWTFSYSAVNDELGKVGGVLVVCNETTKNINQLKISRDKEQLFRNIFIEAPVAVAIMKGETFIVEFANKKVLEYWDKTLEQVINKPIFEALPEAASQGLEALLNEVYVSGKRYAAEELSVDLFRNGQLKKNYITFIYEPYYDLAGKMDGIIVLANEVTNQVTATKKIEEAEERARVAIESAELGFYEKVILTGEMITDNAFNAALDLTPPFTYKDFILAIHPEDLCFRNKAFAEALITGKLKYEARFVWKDNSVHWIKVTGKVIYDEYHKPEKMAGIVQDITIQRELDRHKDEFISIVSHELKTPLTSLMLCNDVMKEKLQLSTDVELAGIIIRMDKQLHRLYYIIRDLTDVTRIEHSQLKYRKSDFDFSELLIEIIQEVQGMTHTHKIVFDNNASATVYADKEKINQVVTNLLTNAIKFSPAAAIVEVDVHLHNNELVCSIQDFGSGIPKNKQTRIFEKFYQLAGSGKRNTGFGLGLYVSAQIIKGQHGKMWVESSLGKGSTFYFTLPTLVNQSSVLSLSKPLAEY